MISYTVGALAADLGDVMNALLDAAASKKLAALFSFPELRSSDDVTRLIAVLQRDERWQVRDVPWKEAPRDAVIVGLNWRTPSGKLSRVMGFAPLGTMPVTRRAPFVAIAMWPGEKDNPWRPGPPNAKYVSFADMPHDHDEGEHAALWANSQAWTADLLARPPEGAARPTASFCLEPNARVTLFPATGEQATNAE